jgi:hypothetical protein
LNGSQKEGVASDCSCSSLIRCSRRLLSSKLTFELIIFFAMSSLLLPEATKKPSAGHERHGCHLRPLHPPFMPLYPPDMLHSSAAQNDLFLWLPYVPFTKKRRKHIFSMKLNARYLRPLQRSGIPLIRSPKRLLSLFASHIFHEEKKEPYVLYESRYVLYYLRPLQRPGIPLIRSPEGLLQDTSHGVSAQAAQLLNAFRSREGLDGCCTVCLHKKKMREIQCVRSMGAWFLAPKWAVSC